NYLFTDPTIGGLINSDLDLDGIKEQIFSKYGSNEIVSYQYNDQSISYLQFSKGSSQGSYLPIYNPHQYDLVDLNNDNADDIISLEFNKKLYLKKNKTKKENLEFESIL